MAIDWNLISIITFYGLIALYFWTKRKNISVQYKVLFLYKSKFWARVIGRIAKKAPKFWQWFGYLSIPAGFAGMAFILVFLAKKFVELFVTPNAVPAVSPVLPGVRIPGAPIFLPFWYGIIALIFVILVHEFAHGLVAESWGLKLKSAGVGMLALLPLAFVEPNEKKLAKLPIKKQLSIFGAGPFSNMVWAGIVFLLITFVAAPLATNVLEPNGLYVENVQDGLPAYVAGLQAGDIIYKIDNTTANTISDFVDYMAQVKPGQTIHLQTNRANLSIQTTTNPHNSSKAYIGIQFKQNIDVKPDLRAKYGRYPMILYYFSQLLYWILTLNLGIGLVNLLPLSILDGGRMVRIVLENKFKKNKKLIHLLWTFFASLSLFLLLANLLGPYLLKALV